MYEYILSRFTAEEAVSFNCIEPLHSTNYSFRHPIFLHLLKITVGIPTGTTREDIITLPFDCQYNQQRLQLSTINRVKIEG